MQHLASFDTQDEAIETIKEIEALGVASGMENIQPKFNGRSQMYNISATKLADGCRYLLTVDQLP